MTLPTPILNEGLQASLDRAVVMFQKKTRWRELGMDKLREQGNAVLLCGPTGTGKTITAHAIARKLKQQIVSIDFSHVGSSVPGELARNIKKLFETASIRDQNDNTNIVLLDECDTMLVDRSRLGADALWMLEPINQLLVEIRRFRGLVILCTNAGVEFLDPAIQSRILGVYYFEKPDYSTRVKLWQSKWPKKIKFDNYVTESGAVSVPSRPFEHLGSYELTGAEIENVLVDWVSESILHDPERFDFQELCNACERHVTHPLNKLNEVITCGAPNARPTTVSRGKGH